MRGTIPRSLCDLTDDELLDRVFEPEFMHQRTALEVELLWRLAEAQHIIELARAGQRRMEVDLWAFAERAGAPPE